MASLIQEHPFAQRFTRDGGTVLESALEALCVQVGRSVNLLVPSGRLEGLVLGGGYGRGQGGVLETVAGEAPYNDLEFYVFLRGNRLLNETRYRHKLDQLGESLSRTAGLHVEFKIDSLTELRRREVSIFSYDLVSAHRVITGGSSLFTGCEHHLDSRHIVASEPARLLLNRCSGLLLAKEILLKRVLSEEDCDFIGRNIAKARLALGDAWLAAHGEYHWDCLERATRLEARTLAQSDELLNQIAAYHETGVAFKLHPVREAKSAEEFKSELGALINLAIQEWLCLEGRRLRSHFADIRDYAFSTIKKCDPARPWRNFMLNLRTFGVGVALDSYGCRYPRERLFNSLPLLLAGDQFVHQTETRRHLRRQLRTSAQDWPGLVAAYKRIWSCYG
jgi:hypothetical protein